MPSFMGGILAGELRVPDPIVSLEYEGALKSDGFALLDRGLSIRHEERDALSRKRERGLVNGSNCGSFDFAFPKCVKARSPD